MKKVLCLLMLLGGCVIAQAQETKKFRVRGVSFKMVKVEGGTFMMGDANGACSSKFKCQKHEVTLSDYMIGETEVTQALWYSVMGSNPSHFRGKLQRPVENVSWYDCQEFIKKLNKLTGMNFRLPTEAEWEFAARGGNKSEGYMYSGSDDIDEVAWYEDNSADPNKPFYHDDARLDEFNPYLKTHVVKKKKPNELGLYDMSGNVWEWCNDRYDDYSDAAQTNPHGPRKGKLRADRGCSFCGPAFDCMVSSRDFYDSESKGGGLGLRLAL